MYVVSTLLSDCNPLRIADGGLSARIHLTESCRSCACIGKTAASSSKAMDDFSIFSMAEVGFR